VLLETGSTQVWYSDGFQPKQMWFEVKTSVLELKAFSRSSQKGICWSLCVRGACLVLFRKLHHIIDTSRVLTEELKCTLTLFRMTCSSSYYCTWIISAFQIYRKCKQYTYTYQHILPKCTLYNNCA